MHINIAKINFKPIGINIAKVDFSLHDVASYQDEYLTLSALEDGAITITIPDMVDQNYATSISYSKDKSNWTETVVDDTEQTITIPVYNGDDVYLKGVARAWCNVDEDICTHINSSANINASGNIMSLLYADDFKDKTTFPEESQYIFGQLFINNTHLINAKNLILPATTLVDYCYQNMFGGCTSLTTTPELPATTLAFGCYSNMFSGCTSLTTTPELPAITAVSSCYDYMFSGCTSLTTAPALPATTLADSCYSGMFSGCTSLTTAPELPATTLAEWCYHSMFLVCTSLTTAPALPATTLNVNCYRSMFQGCTSLTTAPELPATTLADYCYYNMFKNCTSLVQAPALHATSLVLGCYYEMFLGCTSLTTAPELPATTLANSCYVGMFQGCTSLTTAPELPATTLTSWCYASMFQGCTSLTTAPELPATNLISNCYNAMFSGCQKLNSITMLATDISTSDCLRNWVNGVASTGTFIKAASMTSLHTGISGIPAGWTVIDDSDYLTLSTLEDGEITITIPSAVNATYATSLSYSKDKSTWNETLIDDTKQTITIPATSGENVYLKGIAKQLSNSKANVNINSTANIDVSGNIMSLLYGDDYKDKVAFQSGSSYTLSGLFEENKHLVNAEELILPATELVEWCYNRMFLGCSSLKAVHDLPAIKAKVRCYSNMFTSCSSLTKAPQINANILAPTCYASMFEGCTSLTSAPELHATTLVGYCYHRMFYGCTSLNSITMLATDISADSCLTSWVYNVASTGTFIKSPEMTSLPTGYEGIPAGWTVVDYGAA